MTGTSSVAGSTFGNSASAAERLAESSLHRAVERLTAETGLTFPRSRRVNLRRALATATMETGVAGVDTFLDELDRQPRLLERLVSLVTIGETYFFRHPEQLDVVSRQILPSLIAGEVGDRGTVIRVWSAGCSTGEEAYSLAILANEALSSGPGWEFRVAATDIDREALRRARTASYGRWSFRAELGERARWFEEDGARRRVRSSVADRVTFGADNLSLDAGPPPGLGGPPDLIVCRNVTMYLSDGARRRVAARFLRALAPGGWLMVAPIELSSDVYSAFDTVVLDGFTFYRRLPLRPSERVGADAEATGPRAVVRVRSASRSGGSGCDARVATPQDRAHEDRQPRLPFEHRPRPQPVRSPRRDPAARMATAHRLADQGLLSEARRESELAVREDPHGGRAYLLLASIADAQDDLIAAAAALRRAVYLDRADATAQFRLGLLEWRIGRKRQARARLVTALALVADRGEDETLDEGSDLTVGRLRNTAELLADG
ncbi:MAG: protein-glutamate O-methyltransferase CheR [Candidatus Limnocylindrales bacterium]|nr:protein-glutamate O-methyltransferase CheR [Candidatus Limnocylindrales bacterium]